MSDLLRESHSLVPPAPKLDTIQRIGLSILGIGLVIFLLTLFEQNLTKGNWVFYTMVPSIIVGGLIYGLRTHLKRPAGVQNNNLTRNTFTAMGAGGWLLGIIITGFYTAYYFFYQESALTAAGTEYRPNITQVFDPLSQLLRNSNADIWFVYGASYTIAVLVMGAKALAKYRHSKYQIIRTCSIMFCQFGFAFMVPSIMERLNQPYFLPNYFWPLEYKALMPDKVTSLLSSGKAMAGFVFGWGIIMTLIATPILTYYYGKRWYCSWVCGCGGLANTAGDSFRQLSNKSLTAWKIERIMIYSVLIFVIVMTALVWLDAWWGTLGGASLPVRKVYAFLIGATFSGVIGVGFYPLMGSRVWCRFGCPMAAVLGIIQKFKSRFRITTNGGQCISCGNCSTYCEMGIDVRWYAQRGQDIKRASCVGCGMCSAVCPRGVLNLENGPTEQREEYQVDLIGSLKARNLEKKK
ncbi:MAG: 4Fe-4S binding protein [Akkermansiaceae bacterium]